MKELWARIWEALVFALPITVIVYILALTPLIDFSVTELITFKVGAFLMVAILRIVFKVQLSYILMLFYMLLFAIKKLKLLITVVEKDIRDRVLNAIYKEMGMAKAAQGIAFSLPVSDVAGLVKVEEPKENKE